MQSIRSLLFFAAAYAFLGGSVFPQSIEGKVELLKPAVERAENQRYQGLEIPPAPPEPPTAVVYLEGVFPKEVSAPSRRVTEMAQKNINFRPGLLAIQVGTTVEFPNMDDTYHNVFSYSKTKRFDLGRYRKEEKPGVVMFDKAGVVTLHCEVHDTMRGTILVLDTPFFRKTDMEGVYRLGSLPIGRYVLKAWVNENDVRSQPVELKLGGLLHVDFPAK